MMLISREPVLGNRLTIHSTHDLTLQRLAPTLTIPGLDFRITKHLTRAALDKMISQFCPDFV